MERKIHIAVCSINQTPLDWDNNLKNIREACLNAKLENIDIICFPELSISGYGCEDMFMAKWVVNKSLEYLKEAARFSEGLTVILGCPVAYNEELFNCAVIIRDNKILGIVPKQRLANEEVYYEYRWFKAWNNNFTNINIENKEIPFGRLTFTQEGFNFGIEICEDAWHKERPGNHFSNSGIDTIFNLSASHFTLNKIDTRTSLGSSLVNKNPSLTYAYSNLLGNEAGRIIYDGSSYILSKKRTIFSPRFSFKNFEILSEIITIKNNPTKLTSTYYKNIEITADHQKSKAIAEPQDRRMFFDFPNFKNREFHEFTQAVSLGLYDYLKKSGNKRIVISLSGGADSTACAILSKICYDLARKQRGDAQVAKDLNINPDIINKHDFLYCIYQKTINNSEKTLDSAKIVAENLAAQYSMIEIDDSVQTYLRNSEKILKTTLSWEKDDIPLQNIQARTRAPLIWLIANIKNALLLSTSNRSEAAVGYATMDGDTCGGLAPLGGIDKSFILKWLEWIKNDTTYGNFSFLEILNGIEPSAELKPANYNQKDEDDLMPYDVLNQIERLFILRKLSPDQIIINLKNTFPDHASDKIEAWVNLFLDKWVKNQWKRERLAPSFHLDLQSLDPKTWCRYPILSGKIK